eukprot:2147480-Prymnesium_polylepis.1
MNGSFKGRMFRRNDETAGLNVLKSASDDVLTTSGGYDTRATSARCSSQPSTDQTFVDTVESTSKEPKTASPRHATTPEARSRNGPQSSTCFGPKECGNAASLMTSQEESHANEPHRRVLKARYTSR